MSKQIKKQNRKQKKISKFIRTCERCGNEQFSSKPVYKCKHCKAWNGVGEMYQKRFRKGDSMRDLIETIAMGLFLSAIAIAIEIYYGRKDK